MTNKTMTTEEQARFDAALQMYHETGNEELGQALRAAWPAETAKEEEMPDRYTYPDGIADDLEFCIWLYEMTGDDDLRRAIEITWPDAQLPTPHRVLWTYTCECGTRNVVRIAHTDAGSHFCTNCGRRHTQRDQKEEQA